MGKRWFIDMIFEGFEGCSGGLRMRKRWLRLAMRRKCGGVVGFLYLFSGFPFSKVEDAGG